jgi:Flp pilus assembly pilin Flp
MFLEVFLYVTMTSARRSSGLSPSSRPRTVESAPTSSSARVRVRDDRGREVNHLTSFFTTLDTLRKREEGQTMAEYGVVLAVITIGVVAALGLLSGAISDAINRVIGFL